ncbi:MAG TPA: FAD-binding oxidoreductase [Actinomycetes bacterium]|nr:FAD-binding oxidoreductase [Actinomycetes bacterium]
MTVTARDVRRLDADLGGSAVHRDERGYVDAAASPFPNLSVPWVPDVVVRCSGVSDVMRSVRFATSHGLGVAVRSGGVGWVGAPPGTLLLDLRDLDGVLINPRTRILRVQGGAVWRDVARELAPFGLAAAAPQFPRLGVAGHVLGGGHGWLTSRLGWASDTVRAVEVVTAEGRVVRATEEDEADLFWAMRGAGHNFGAVIGLELDLVPLEEVSFGVVWFHPDATADALASYRDWVVGLPDEVTTIGSVGHPPAGWGGPAELEGRAAAHVLLCHCGSAAQAGRDLAGLRAHPGVVADSVRRVPWPELALGNDVFASGVHRRSRMHYLRHFGDDVVAISAQRARDMAALTFMSTHYYGGVVQRIPEDATAMSHRGIPWNYMVATTWTSMENGAPLTRWQDEYLAEIAEHSVDAYYVNYLCAEPEHVAAAYNTRTWDRLRRLKAQWDPQNVFSANQNVPPA